jgi:hypothetical protein
MRLYRYVGPKRIADRVEPIPAGTPIRCADDLYRWIRDSEQELDADDCVIATFVIDANGVLLVADRRSEHVACAGRQLVLSAGELTIRSSDSTVVVIGASNQSTGYCPEPESWPAVATALRLAGLEAPAGFTLECVFRLCPKCGNKNLVKDSVFDCGVCGSSLPVAYNCQDQ